MPDLPVASIVQTLNLIPPGWYYVLLFLAFTAEGISFPLLHVPAVVLFLATSYLVSTGHVSLVAAIAVAAGGSTTGGFVTYRIGIRMAGDGGRDGRGGAAGLWANSARIERVGALVSRYGALLALAARWLGVLRPAALLGAGMARVNAYKVVLALGAGSLVYCSLFQLLAMGFGTLLVRASAAVNPWVVIGSVAGSALVWLGGVYVLRRLGF